MMKLDKKPVVWYDVSKVIQVKNPEGFSLSNKNSGFYFLLLNS